MIDTTERGPDMPVITCRETSPDGGIVWVMDGEAEEVLVRALGDHYDALATKARASQDQAAITAWWDLGHVCRMLGIL